MNNRMFYVYILTNHSNRVLYTGVTNDLVRRMHQHKNKLLDGFTRKYNCNKLVWFAETESVESAIRKEKQIKAGSRNKKIQLIEAINPKWIDLSLEWDRLQRRYRSMNVPDTFYLLHPCSRPRNDKTGVIASVSAAIPIFEIATSLPLLAITFFQIIITFH